jgi:hypothetical protein
MGIKRFFSAARGGSRNTLRVCVCCVKKELWSVEGGEKWELVKALVGVIFSLQPFSSFLWRLWARYLPRSYNYRQFVFKIC